jgi:hypothetical protein
VKRVSSHTLVEFDKDDQTAVGKMTNKVAIISDTFFQLERMFTEAEWNNAEAGWTFKDRAHPTMSRTGVLEDLARVNRHLKELHEMSEAFRERVKTAK